MGSLNQKVALVTGGASGIGSAIARRLSADCATVVITDIQPSLGQETARRGRFEFLQQDVCDELRWNEVVQTLMERFGRLDVLVNNAGILGPMESVTPENTRIADWKRVFAVNVDGAFLGCRAAIASMRKTGQGGAIVNVGSIAGTLATPYATAYGASKAAVNQLTKSVAQYCAQERLKIRCNCVLPGSVRTDMWTAQATQSARQRGVSLEQLITEGEGEVPMGDFTRPEDIAAAVSFLASNEARHITGIQLIVDGGIVGCDTFQMMRVNELLTSTKEKGS
jgi:3(or 17)beta-hydroxysteroid dehydrogenase